MPIPTKPLREMLAREIMALYPPNMSDRHHQAGRFVEAAMRALAEYDPTFAKAAEAGEPTFTLRARDIIAPEAILAWIDGALCHASMPKIDDALAITDAMRAWPNRRLPD